MRTNIEVNIEIDDLTALLQNPKNSGTNQLLCDCPFCNSKAHFYVNKTNYFWDCKKCKEAGGIKKLLIHFNVLDQFTHKTLRLDQLVTIGDEPEVEDDITLADLPNKSLPIGYKRVYKNDYLQSRGLSVNDFYKYNIGISNKSQKLKDYVIMVIEEDGKCKGFVSRCCLSKDVIESQDLLRYKNSSGTKFNSLLFGYEEIIRGTTTVIIVEGVFDKIRLDNLLRTHESPVVKVVCTFGNKISDNQLKKLRITGVENLILFYDLDAIEEMKKSVPKLKKYFFLRISCLSGGKDPGDAPEEEVLNALYNDYDPTEFFYEKCNGRKIKI